MKAAIELIKDRVSFFEGCSPAIIAVVFGADYIESLRQALAILEAAEKIDKKEALWAADCAGEPLAVYLKPYRSDKTFEDWRKNMNQIEVLLSALPDKE